MKASLSAKSEAIAYRIWAYCEPKGWDLNVPEVAEALGISANQVGAILRLKNWHERMRANSSAAWFGGTYRTLIHRVGSEEAKQLLDIDRIMERDQ